MPSDLAEPRASLPEPRAVGSVPRFLRSIEKRFYAPWFWGKEFSADWVTTHIPMWRRVLADWRDRPVRILEIGSWEGRSALFFLKFLPHSHITCIDTFTGGKGEVRGCATEVPHTEGRFDRNLAPYAARVETIRSRSVPALESLAAAGRRFDLAYIDGSHVSTDVIDDTVRVWPLIVPGGVVIWDDYHRRDDIPAEERPQAVIDQFLAERAGHFRLLFSGAQMIVERLA
jgi:hypothetical protein